MLFRSKRDYLSFGTYMGHSLSYLDNLLVLTYVYTMTYFISLNQDISLHSNTYEKIQANANQIWKYERYSLVMEYEQRPVLVPPFIIDNHVLYIMRALYRWLRNCRRGPDENGQDGFNSDWPSKNLCSCKRANYDIFIKEVKETNGVFH